MNNTEPTGQRFNLPPLLYGGPNLLILPHAATLDEEAMAESLIDEYTLDDPTITVFEAAATCNECASSGQRWPSRAWRPRTPRYTFRALASPRPGRPRRSQPKEQQYSSPINLFRATTKRSNRHLIVWRVTNCPGHGLMMSHIIEGGCLLLMQPVALDEGVGLTVSYRRRLDKEFPFQRLVLLHG